MIYFIQSSCPNAFIKIGKAKDVYDRLYCIQTSSPYPLKLLAVTCEYEEGVLHKHFNALRFNREWFHPGQELLDFIDWIKRGETFVNNGLMRNLKQSLESNEEESKQEFKEERKKERSNRDNELISFYKNYPGFTLSRIGREFGIDPSIVRRVLGSLYTGKYIISDDTKLQILNLCKKKVALETIQKQFYFIPKRNLEIINAVANNPTLTLDKIGERYCLTKERVRQILGKAISKLKNAGKKEKRINEEDKVTIQVIAFCRQQQRCIEEVQQQFPTLTLSKLHSITAGRVKLLRRLKYSIEHKLIYDFAMANPSMPRKEIVAQLQKLYPDNNMSDGLIDNVMSRFGIRRGLMCTIWISNGKQYARIQEGEEIPDGWERKGPSHKHVNEQVKIAS